MNPEKRREIFRRLQAANPNPTTELSYSTPYELLVAVVLSAQATDKSVNLATAELFKKANTPEKMVKLGVAGLENYIKRLEALYTELAGRREGSPAEDRWLRHETVST
jgi:endonuclease III